METEPMMTKLQKWGNSQGLRLSKAMLAEVALEVGDTVDVAVHDGRIVLTPLRRVRGGHDLRDLVRRMPKGEKAEALDWGPPVGKEAW
jgi:antitoxin MazE